MYVCKIIDSHHTRDNETCGGMNVTLCFPRSKKRIALPSAALFPLSQPFPDVSSCRTSFATLFVFLAAYFLFYL